MSWPGRDDNDSPTTTIWQRRYVILTIKMIEYSQAVSDFREARNRAGLRELWARLSGQSIELLSYEEVRKQLRITGVRNRTLEEIPMSAIVGSVDRYQDFTRDFLPRLDSDEGRWAKVKVANARATGLPPIDLFKIDDAYFVIDGHHRISVAKANKAKTIQAYVTEVRSRVPISADIQPDELIIKAEYLDFLETTGLDLIRPDADLSVTCVGQYDVLLEHIEVHRYYMGIDQNREIDYSEAVEHWYDAVYEPLIESIRRLGVLHDFPDRTETDLYMWIARHQAEIAESLGWDVPAVSAAADLSEKFAASRSNAILRLGKKAINIVIPDDLESGPSSGVWRREIEAEPGRDTLFADIIVPLSGQDLGWRALESAIKIGMLESGRIHGLHISSEASGDEDDPTKEIADRFYWRLGEVGLEGTFKVEEGPVARAIATRARWTDLVAAGLAHPPKSTPLGRLTSGFRRLLLASSRPVLALPEVESDLARPLLAYDGGPKSQEALYVAAYVAGRWGLPLVVLTVDEGKGEAGLHLERAQAYLEGQKIEASYIKDTGNAAKMILQAAAEHHCDWLILGGYGSPPVVEAVLGSSVNEILRERKLPALVCR